MGVGAARLTGVSALSSLSLTPLPRHPGFPLSLPSTIALNLAALIAESPTAARTQPALPVIPTLLPTVFTPLP